MKTNRGGAEPAGAGGVEPGTHEPGELAKTLPLASGGLAKAWAARRFGPYEPIGLLGEGSMGQVFLARHTLLGRQVALKVMRPEHARSRELVARFFQEARAVNEIDHEHIVEIFDFVEEPEAGLACCVMERLEGKSLGELLRGEPLSVQRACTLARQISEALEAAHRLGVVHRDLKPDNVFVTERLGRDFVKVLDFGVAKLLAPLGPSPVAQTMAGAIVGTPSYMAPEQALGLPVDHRADLYSAGVVLYQMLSGHLPFEAQTFGQLSALLASKRPPPLGRVSASGEQLPGRLRALVMRCLEKRPEERPESMAELARGLGPFCERPARREPVRNGPVWALAALGLAVAVSWGAWAPRLLEAGPASVTLKISSRPPGATVLRIDTGQRLGTTPLSASLQSQRRDLTVRLELDGHRPIERTVRLDEDVGLEVALPPHEPRPLERVTRDGVIDPYAR